MTKVKSSNFGSRSVLISDGEDLKSSKVWVLKRGFWFENFAKGQELIKLKVWRIFES